MDVLGVMQVTEVGVTDPCTMQSLYPTFIILYVAWKSSPVIVISVPPLRDPYLTDIAVIFAPTRKFYDPSLSVPLSA